MLCSKMRGYCLPSLRPPGVRALLSPGQVFLLAVIDTSSRTLSARAPSMPWGRRSTRTRWLSVPPEIFSILGEREPAVSREESLLLRVRVGLAASDQNPSPTRAAAREHTCFWGIDVWLGLITKPGVYWCCFFLFLSACFQKKWLSLNRNEERPFLTLKTKDKQFKWGLHDKTTEVLHVQFPSVWAQWSSFCF